MKKCLPLLILFFLSSRGLQAQIRLGLLGGIHSANIQETNNIPGWDTTTKRYQSSHSGVQIGAILEMPIGHKGFFFQPAILYTAKGRQYNRFYDTTTSLTDSLFAKQSLNLGYVDIPLNLTYKIPLSRNHKNSFFISAGPYISFFYNGKSVNQTLTAPTDTTHKYTNVTEGLSTGRGADTYKTVDMGFNARAGFEFGNVLLTSYMSQGLTSFYNAPYQGTFHHQLLGFSLGIWLTSTEAPPPPPRALPKDSDKDGIPDDQDLCPYQAGTAAWHGCPVPDFDHDGIDDTHDSCPTLPGIAKYNGCPVPDRDGDGVNDDEDKCPDQPGTPRYQGCPIPDRDGDGVNDEEDQCPDQPGTVENHGCPLIKKELEEKINFAASNILFTLGSDRLVKSSGPALDTVASLLQAHPEWIIAIDGHTDNAGTPAKNLILSQKRAEAVRIYLVTKGITATRMQATGYGQEKPVADNATPAGRTANRRVELKVSIGKK